RGHPVTEPAASALTQPSSTSSESPAEAVSDAVGALLREIHELAVRLRTFQASGEGPEHESMAARNVLQTLGSSSPQSVPQIALGRSTSRQNIQVLADRLARAGCVEFVENPRHQRSPLVRLTERGWALLEELNATEGKAARLLSTALEANDVQTALRVMRRIGQLLGETPAGKAHPTVERKAKPGPVQGEDAKRARKPPRAVRRKAVPMETYFEPGTDLPVALL
ncbi:MAG: MarR family winged helix-turn-helix transcriptional regulator, partial [Limisphaerales bacterium]